MSKQAMREEAERLIRETMAKKNIVVKQGNTRIDACAEMRRAEPVQAEKGATRSSSPARNAATAGDAVAAQNLARSWRESNSLKANFGEGQGTALVRDSAFAGRAPTRPSQSELCSLGAHPPSAEGGLRRTRAGREEYARNRSLFPPSRTLCFSSSFIFLMAGPG